MTLILIVWLVLLCSTVSQAGPERFDRSVMLQQIRHLERKGVWRDARAQARIELISDRLQPQFRPRYRLLQDASLNAWALPGGTIFMHQGLFTYGLSDSEIAFVVAHEMAHVTRRHVPRRLGRTTGVAVVLAAATCNAGILAQSGAGVLTYGMSQGFSRQMEAEADRDAVARLRGSGFDPHAAVQFLQRFVGRERRLWPRWRSTHPFTAERLRALGEVTAEPPMAVAVFSPRVPIEVPGEHGDFIKYRIETELSKRPGASQPVRVAHNLRIEPDVERYRIHGTVRWNERTLTINRFVPRVYLGDLERRVAMHEMLEDAMGELSRTAPNHGE